MRAQIDPEIHRRSKRRNRLNTLLIVGGMTLLLALCGWVLFGGLGFLWALGLGAMVWIFTPRFSPDLVLRLYRARRLTPTRAPDLMRVVQVLAERAGLPATPDLYYVPSSNMNAFAVGDREQSAITLTDGLLRKLDMRQLIGVLAHETAHISNEDLRVMGLADVVSRLTVSMQTVGIIMLLFGLWHGSHLVLAAVLLMLAPLLGTLLQLALSRSREYDADLTAVTLTGDPAGLALALRTLERSQGSVWESVVLPGGRTPDPSILRTHPLTENRIQRLMELVPQFKPYFDMPEQQSPAPVRYRPVKRPPRYHATGFWY